ALLLLHHVVHGCGAVVDFADLVVLPGVVEDALRRGGLTSIDVRHDADVAGALEGELTLGHRQITSVFFVRTLKGLRPEIGPETRSASVSGDGLRQTWWQQDSRDGRCQAPTVESADV